MTPTLEAFHQTGGQVRLFQGAKLDFFGGNRNNAITFYPSSSFTPTFIAQNAVFAGSAINMFNKLSSFNVILQVTNCSNGYDLAATQIFASTNLWFVTFTQNIVAYGSINNLVVDLTQGNITNAVNTVNGYILEHLRSFTSKQDAKNNGIPINSAFILKREVDASNLQPNVEYKITFVGTPSLGVLGNYLIATGTESGTGKGTLVERCVMI